MQDCIFCKIIAGEIPCDKVLENDWVLAFRDIDPKAPQHILIIPKKHMESALAVRDEDLPYWDAILHAAQEIASQQGVDESGFRMVINTGEHGGQTVPHLHLHLLGGRYLAWPPG